MTELVGVEDRVDRLDHAVGDIELDHADYEPFGVVHHGARVGR
jgi:hypothetical protein